MWWHFEEELAHSLKYAAERRQNGSRKETQTIKKQPRSGDRAVEEKIANK
jgi:hypothetical protein